MQNWIHRIFWRVRDFFDSWIYPAHRLQNYFIHRYDTVRMPQLERSRYYEVEERMYHAVMELVRYYYEECQKQFNWRDDLDEEGNLAVEGPRYGARSDKCLFPEYKDKYIIDIIAEIHDWYTRGYDQFMKAYEYGGWKLAQHRNIIARDLKRIRKECRHNTELSVDQLEREYLNGYDVPLEILDKYLDGDRRNIVDKAFMNAVKERILEDIERNKQKYLHLAIEVREHLWT